MRTIYRSFILASCAVLVITVICGLPAKAQAATARGQGITTAQLPEELRSITVQSRFIPGQGAPIGKVRRLRGQLVVRHGNAPEAYFAAQGDNLEGNILMAVRRR